MAAMQLISSPFPLITPHFRSGAGCPNRDKLGSRGNCSSGYHPALQWPQGACRASPAVNPSILSHKADTSSRPAGRGANDPGGPTLPCIHRRSRQSWDSCRPMCQTSGTCQGDGDGKLAPTVQPTAATFLSERTDCSKISPTVRAERGARAPAAGRHLSH